MKSISDAEYKTTIAQTDKPVVVEFSAPAWCPPCKTYAPIFEAAATALKDTAHFYLVDIDECPEAAVEANILSIPTTVIFKNGVEVGRKNGVVKELEKWIQESK